MEIIKFLKNSLIIIVIYSSLSQSTAWADFDFPKFKDTDADGVSDIFDNCDGVPNKDQVDKNKDGIGDACVKIITAGWSHFCTILNDGKVKCWGLNDQGQLGIGTKEHKAKPTLVAVFGTTAITAGQSHTCAVITGGNVKCWGSNMSGALGIGNSNTKYKSLFPTSVDLNEIISIAAGSWHTCAVKKNGDVYCWGNNSYGQSAGILPPPGYEEMTDDQYLEPHLVPYLNDAKVVAAGERHTCAIRKGGEIVCWGHNEEGELGNGTTTSSVYPVSVKSIDNALALALGYGYSCALVDGGQVKCWGKGWKGVNWSAGWEKNENYKLPNPVPGLQQGVDKLASGYPEIEDNETCVILEKNGSVKCFGDYFGDQLNGVFAVEDLIPGLTGAMNIAILKSMFPPFFKEYEQLMECLLMKNGGILCRTWNNKRVDPFNF